MARWQTWALVWKLRAGVSDGPCLFVRGALLSLVTNSACVGGSRIGVSNTLFYNTHAMFTNATSAVKGMSVAEVRKALQQIRQTWTDSSESAPLWLCDVLVIDSGGVCNGAGGPDAPLPATARTIADFSTEFVYGHHLKRHEKSLHKRDALAKAARGFDAPPHRAAPTCVQGPKGLPGDPFPFTAGWMPKTAAGRAAFEAAGTMGWWCQ